MGFLSHLAINAILNYYLNGGSMTTITSSKLYLGLATGLTAATGAITGEPATANGYNRVEINVGSSTPVFGATTNGVITNNNATLTFPTNTTSDWGQLGYWFISTTGTPGAGTWIMGGQINSGSGVTVAVNQAPTFATSQLTLTATDW
jgi:hypothetical protein